MYRHHAASLVFYHTDLSNIDTQNLSNWLLFIVFVELSLKQLPALQRLSAVGTWFSTNLESRSLKYLETTADNVLTWIENDAGVILPSVSHLVLRQYNDETFPMQVCDLYPQAGICSTAIWWRFDDSKKELH